MKKYIRYSIAVVVVLVGVICLFPRGVVKAGDATDNQASVSTTEQTQQQDNQSSLDKSQPLPSPETYSLERQNLLDRAKFEAKQGTTGYVALIGPMGQLVAYYTIQGKVTSLNSYLTGAQQMKCNEEGADPSCVTVDSPDFDGSYGMNPEGVFFFTTSGQYVEWSGNYLYSDQPMNYVTPPVLVTTEK